MTNEAQEKKTRTTDSLFGAVATDGAEHKAYEALASRRRLMGRLLWSVVALGVIVLVWLVAGGAWRNAKVKADAALEVRRAEYKAEQDAKNNDIEFTYVGSPDALLKLEWHYRPAESRNQRMLAVMQEAVNQKPSEVCIVNAAKPLVQGLPLEEYDVTFSINGSYTAEHIREDGTVETVELTNEMDAKLLAEIIMQYHVKLYGDVQWPLVIEPPPEEEKAEAAEEEELPRHDAEPKASGEEVAAAVDDGTPVQIPAEVPMTQEKMKLPELKLGDGK